MIAPARNDVRTGKCSAVALAAVLLSACSGPAIQPEQLAGSAGFERIELLGTQFIHASYRSPAAVRAQRSDEILWVFIEGDGRPWVQGGREPASDPTAKRPLALQLAVQMQEPALYLGRPCYDGATAAGGCTFEWWTEGRYSQPVIDSMAAAVRTVQNQSGFRRVALVGYSGGGTLAVLLAQQLRDVAGVVTIAANLDIAAWTEHHGYLPLTRSQNPAELAQQSNWPQIHLVGERDQVAPPRINERYFVHHPKDVRWEYADYDHVCCWREEWPRIVQRLRTEFPLAFPLNRNY